MGQVVQPSNDILDRVNALYTGMGDYQKMKTAVDSLSPSERTAVIEYLNQKVRLAGLGPSDAEDVLVNMGDDEAISREAKTFPFESTGGGSFLIWTIQPKVVPALMPYVYVNEPSPYNDEGGPAKSFFAAEALRELLQRSPYFSKDVNHWAASWYAKGGNPPYVFREMMRRWWTENRQYFAGGNYGAVKPGPPPPSNLPSVSTGSLPAPSPPLLPNPLPQETTPGLRMPQLSARWSPSFLSGEVSLIITNDGTQPISVSPYLGVAVHSIHSIPATPTHNLDKGVINPSVEFILAPGKFSGLSEEGTMQHPVTVAPNTTKTIKLQVPPGVSDIAKLTNEAILRLRLGDNVLSVEDLKSFTKK